METPSRKKTSGRTITIAVTGGLATGKSTVSRMLEEFGVGRIDADEIAHEAFKEDPKIKETILKRFGRECTTADGEIDRKRLGDIAFADCSAMSFLESLIHPVVRSEIASRVAKLCGDGAAAVAIEIPLLFEIGWDDEFDIVIVAACDMEIQITRCAKKFGVDRAEAGRRIASQRPIEEKMQRADYVISTNGTHDETRGQAKDILCRILGTEQLI